jgi:radical SAM superfamily enzyme YgiQ (UPF0313 family)
MADMADIRVLLVSTYELGHQPFGLASPAAWLKAAGARVRCLDLSRQELDQDAVREARLIAFYLPMHTATRLAVRALAKIRAINPDAHLCAYGLYAPANAEYLRKLGVSTILGGEFEEGLISLLKRLQSGDAETQREPEVSLARQHFLPPLRDGLPPLERYAHLTLPDESNRVAGYTEATRGCKHLCRHCPIVPVYGGAFRVVQRDVVLEDIRRQVAAGAQHITFGDPDFFNGPAHALEIVRALHHERPQVSYDVTIKIEHLLKHWDLLPELRDTGCAFVTSAVESVDDGVLALLDKGHTRADFIRAAELMRSVGLFLVPTFVPFTPWTTLEGYQDLLSTIARLGLAEQVPPVQLTIRLLIPAGSKLLELSEVRELVGEFDEAALSYPWSNPDPRVDALQRELEQVAQREAKAKAPRVTLFAEIWRSLHRAMGLEEGAAPLPPVPPGRVRATVPYLTEPWYC